MGRLSKLQAIIQSQLEPRFVVSWFMPVGIEFAYQSEIESGLGGEAEIGKMGASFLKVKAHGLQNP